MIAITIHDPRQFVRDLLPEGYSQAVDNSNKEVHDIFLDLQEQERIARENGFSSINRYDRYIRLMRLLPIYC